MAKWEVRYGGREHRHRNRDAVGLRLEVWREGDRIGPVDAVISGPAVEAIARNLDGDSHEPVYRAAALWAARELEHAPPPEAGGEVAELAVDAWAVEKLARSDELPELAEGVAFHAFERE